MLNPTSFSFSFRDFNNYSIDFLLLAIIIITSSAYTFICVILEASVSLDISSLILWPNVTLKRNVDKESPFLTPMKTENFSDKLCSRKVIPSDYSTVIIINPTNLAGIFVCCNISYIFILCMESRSCLKSTNNTCRFMSYSYTFSIMCVNIKI